MKSPKQKVRGVPKAPASPPVRLVQQPWFYPMLLVALALAAYFNSFGQGLAVDAPLLVQDPRVHSLNGANLHAILTEPYWWNNPGAALYRPVTTLSFLLNYAILGNADDPSGYHAVNFLLHAGNAVLVYGLCLLLFEAGLPAFFAALLWAVHPAGVESVTNVSGRADLLVTLGVLSGLVWYFRRSRQAEARPWTTAGILFAIALFGVFSKESAVVLPGLMLLGDISFAREGASWQRRWPAYAAAAAVVAIWFVAWRKMPAMLIPYLDNPMIGADFWTVRLTAVKVLGRYLGLLLFPLRLSADYSFNQVPLGGWGDAEALFALAAIGAILAMVLLRYRRDPLLFFLAGCFAITILPVSNLVIIIGSIMAERFLYLPSIPFAIALTVLLFRAGRRLGKEQGAAWVATALAVAYGGRTYARNFDWKDDDTIWAANLAAAPGSFKAHNNNAIRLFRLDPERNLDRVIAELETVWRLVGHLPLADLPEGVMSDFGECYRRKGELAGGAKTAEGRAWLEKSRAWLERARELDRLNDRTLFAVERARGGQVHKVFGLPDLYRNLGHLYLNLGLTTEALEACRHGRLIEPHNPLFYAAIAAVQFTQGDRPAAALTLLEQFLIGAAAPDTLTTLRGLYADFPDGACAFTETGAGPQLNPGCPRMARDLCTAHTEMVGYLVAAHQIPEARERKEYAVTRYACPATPLDALLPN